MQQKVLIRTAGVCDYYSTWQDMMQFTRNRNPNTVDEIWCLQHHPVYTLGMAGKTEHILNTGDVPVIKTDRGGQVTYHGPGQLIVYLLIDLVRMKLMVKRFVYMIEQSIIDMCESLQIVAERHSGAPGVYVNGQKMAALGVRVKQGRSYHGLALNVDMDLAPFRDINPCGYPGMQVTQLSTQGCYLNVEQASEYLLPFLMNQFGYECIERTENADGQESAKEIRIA